MPRKQPADPTRFIPLPPKRRKGDGGRPLSDPYRYLPSEIIAAGPSEEQMAYAVAMRDRQVAFLDFKRRLVDWVGVHKVCPRNACRRAANACSAKVDCYRPCEPFFTEHVYPGLRKALRARRRDEGGAGDTSTLAGRPPSTVLHETAGNGSAPAWSPVDSVASMENAGSVAPAAPDVLRPLARASITLWAMPARTP